MYANPTLNSGTTRTDTVTGVGSIPASGVLGVKIGIGLFSVNAQGGYVQVYPAGGTAGQYVGFTAAGPINTYCTGFIEVPVSSGGQITVKANGANIVLQDWYIIAYIM